MGKGNSAQQINKVTVWLVLLAAGLIVLYVVYMLTAAGNRIEPIADASPSIVATPAAANPAVSPTDAPEGYIDEELTPVQNTSNSLSDIIANPNQYIGKEVTVIAEIEEQIDSQTFTLDASGITNDTLLVVADRPLVGIEDDSLLGDELWQVTGTVGVFEFSREADRFGIDWQEALFSAYEGQPYINARKVILYQNNL